MVAGSDDPGALWYNPAGLAYSGKQLIGDLVLPIEKLDFQRVDGGGNPTRKVSSTSDLLPVPGLGYSDNFGLKHVTFGVGMFVPPATVHTYKRCYAYDDTGLCTDPAPQRYSLVGMSGSGFGMLSAGVAVRPFKWLSLGAAATAAMGRFVVDVVMSLCDNKATCSTPESPRFDGNARITVPGSGFPAVVSPMGSIGAVIDLSEVVPIRIGSSFSTSYKFKGTAKLDIDIPQEGIYQGATLTNNTAKFATDFPWIFRTGIEARPIERLRTEVSFTWEGWHVQDAMSVRPNNIAIQSPALGGQSIALGAIDIKLGLRDTYAFGLGSEYALSDKWQLRGGLMYETSAVTEQYFSLLTPDSEKLLIGLGASVSIQEGVNVDFSAGQLVMKNRDIACTKVFAPDPLRPPARQPSCAEQRAINRGDQDRDPASAEPLANGKYELETWFAGVGLRWRFDAKAARKSASSGQQASATQAGATQAVR